MTKEVYNYNRQDLTTDETDLFLTKQRRTVRQTLIAFLTHLRNKGSVAGIQASRLVRSVITY